MHKRFLLIIIDKFLCHFLLLSSDGRHVSLLKKRRQKIYRGGYEFSLADFIIQTLDIWGREVGLQMIKEGIPIMPEVENEGVSDIIILTGENAPDLNAITEKVYIIGDQVKQEGALNVTKFVDFDNFLFIAFDNNDTSIVKYSKTKKGSIKVVAERKEFSLSKLQNDNSFMSFIKDFASLIDQQDYLDMIKNQTVIPDANIQTFESSIFEYLLSIYRLKPFLQCKKLNLSSFGAGDIDKEKLIISGEKFRLGWNAPLLLLAVSSTFNLTGDYTVLIDRYGLCDFMQRQGEQLLEDDVYTNLLADFWGRVLSILPKNKKSAKSDEVVADIDILDGTSPRQIIPMFERVTKFSFSDSGRMELEMRKNYTLRNNKTVLKMKDMNRNVVIDARTRPISYELNGSIDSEKLKSWLKGIEAYI